MVTSLSKAAKTTIVAAFAVAIFAFAGYYAYTFGQASADTPLPSVPPLISNSTEPRPFYEDMRYIILIADAVLVLGMVMTLTFRLINRLLPGGPVEPETNAKKNRKDPITVDELNMDIPL